MCLHDSEPPHPKHRSTKPILNPKQAENAYEPRNSGDASAGSDLDFLVIEPEVERPRAESARLRCTLLEIEVPIDVIVVSEQHAEDWGRVEGTLVNAALAEGRVLSG